MVFKIETEEFWNTIVVVFVRFDVLSFLVKVLAISTGIIFGLFSIFFHSRRSKLQFFSKAKTP